MNSFIVNQVTNQDLSNSHVNTINKINNVNDNQDDIILTEVGKEEVIDKQLFGNGDSQANKSNITQHHKVGQTVTKSGLNYDYDKVGQILVSKDDAVNFINVLSEEFGILSESEEEDDDITSVISETPDINAFNNMNYFDYKTNTIQEVNLDNNLKYDISKVGLGKTYISGASCYPPRLDTNYTLGAYHAHTGNCTNVSIRDRVVREETTKREIVDIQEGGEGEENPIFLSDTNYEFYQTNDKNNGCIIHGINTIELVQDETEHICVGNEIIIPTKADKWHVHVPIRDGNGKINWIYLFADPGANVGCVKSSWAWYHFRDYIRRNNRKANGIKTPGGVVSPKYVLWMTFPSVTGQILKVRMYLIDDLPVDILADINMLKAFGYVFKDETPPFFRHPAEPDIDLELKDQDEMFKIHNTTEFEQYQINKRSFDNKPIVNLVENTLHSKLFSGNKLLYVDEGRVNYFPDNVNDKVEKNQQVLTKSDINYYYEKLRKLKQSELDIKREIDNLEKQRNYQNCNLYYYQTPGLIDYDQIDTENLETVKLDNDQVSVNVINDKLRYINTVLSVTGDKDNELIDYNYNYEFSDPKVDPHGKSIKDAKIWHKCMLIVAKQSFIADSAEKQRARKGFENEKLEFANLDYLKEYPQKYGPRFKGLYEGVQALINKYHHNVENGIFAEFQFDRKTMNVPPARLGIKPEFRDKTMFAQQYPINEQKRRDMINYTIENEKNGFWEPIKQSLHCVPYTMVPKKRHGIIYRYRPAFDGRVVNKYCELMDANMPTIKDIDDLHSIPGFVTCADVKNCFDCIPLDERDWPYAVCLTPLGLYQMKCLTYGWMNAAPEAQKIMNNLALHVGNTLAYIDDIAIKHPLEGNTQDILDSIERLFSYCKDKNIQLHPGKFFPACTESEGFSFVRTLDGTRVGEPYIKKVLALAKPTTVKQLQEFIGVLGYIGRFIYHKSLLTYWLNDLIAKAHGKGKIKWTKEANLAYEQLLFLVANSPLLYNPTKDGEFCLKTDACNYGIGAVLYQQQTDQQTKEKKWVIVDMWSKTMPSQLRHCHSMVHEAYAIVHAMEHWQFFLIKRKFKLSTDNNPVATIFSHKYRDLNPITQKQLLRLRNKIQMFHFDVYHVPGIDNELADSLSRFTSELLERQGEPRTINPWISEDTNNQPLSKEDKESLDLYLKQGENLKEKQTNLSMDKSFHSISNLMCFDEKEKLAVFQQQQQRNWLNVLHDYHNTANYLEAPQIKDYLNSADQECVNFDQFDEPTFLHLRDNVINIAHSLHQLPQNTVHKLSEKVQQFETNNHSHIVQQKQKYTNHLADIHHNLMVVGQDDNYNPEDDIKDLSPNERNARRTKGVVTRSMAKREAKRQKLKRLRKSHPDSNDPLVKGQEKEFMQGIYDYLNAEYNRARFQTKTRDEFLFDIFGHRRDLDIFNTKTFVNYQKSDAIINAAKKILSESLDINSDEFSYLMDIDPGLAAKVQDKKVRVNNKGVFQVKDKVSEFDGTKWLNYVPFVIRGKMMDYAHHNLQLHHFEYRQTLNGLKHKYWWSTMVKDIRKFCDTCISCQFIKGSTRHRAPLRIRELPTPRSHLFADFLGTIYNRYYILVLVDYATGYTMLIPTTNTDFQTVVNAILNHWVKIFGWFETFESDWGQGFNSKVLEALTRSATIKLELAEPRNHRSIGKVERTIGFLQSIINQYNVLLSNKLVQEGIESYEQAWEIIKIILPFVQLSINQKRSRFTAISPNMLMLGSNVRDASDLGDLNAELRKVDIDVNINSDDYKYVESLFTRIQELHQIFKNDWKEYCRVSRKYYNERWKISKKRINWYKRQFKIGTKVLYFIGDKEVSQRKWRRKWSGPWIISKHLNDSTCIITDSDSGNQKRVSFDRLKVFKERDVGYYQEYFEDDDVYQMYYNRQKELLYNTSVKMRRKDVNLDYNQPGILKEKQQEEDQSEEQSKANKQNQ